MAGNIKGITIELSGDTTKLEKALRNVNRETQTLGTGGKLCDFVMYRKN